MPTFSQVGEQPHQETHQEEREVHVDARSTPPPEVRPPPEESPLDESPASEPPAVVNVNLHTPAPAAPPPVTAVSSMVDHTPELQAKLDDAYAEIERLRNLISSMPDPSTAPTATLTSATPTELRRRTRAISDDGSTISPETDVGSLMEEGIVQPEGVPLQVVIIVALGVFITTYLFF